MMQAFWKFDPLTTRLMFEDLFNETKSVEGRVGRFLFGCDTLLRDYKKHFPNIVDNNHYHDDYQMIALYLAFRYPESYAPYDLHVFQTTMRTLGARDIPAQNDPARYFKVLRTITTFIEKDPGVEERMTQLLDKKNHFMGKTLLLAEDFCCYVAASQSVA